MKGKCASTIRNGRSVSVTEAFLLRFIGRTRTPYIYKFNLGKKNTLYSNATCRRRNSMQICIKNNKKRHYELIPECNSCNVLDNG